MKILFFMVMSLLPALAQAKASDCPSQVIKNQKWNYLTEDQIQCMHVHNSFLESLSYLCSKDKSALSKEYAKYRSYELAYEEASKAFSNSTSPSDRARFQFELRKIDREWTIFGFRTEVSQAMSLGYDAEYQCSGRR
jgi:hypothetical protein